MTLDQIIDEALREDIGDGDHTSDACIPENALGKAKLLVKEDGVIAGVDLALRIFNRVDSNLLVTTLIADGSDIRVGDIVLTVEGSSRSILKGRAFGAELYAAHERHCHPNAPLMSPY
jgi:nicotinate-nucleotide pyrophosphorylase (carboxylating)